VRHPDQGRAGGLVATDAHKWLNVPLHARDRPLRAPGAPQCDGTRRTPFPIRPRSRIDGLQPGFSRRARSAPVWRQSRS
jgi:hypothetical protein